MSTKEVSLKSFIFSIILIVVTTVIGYYMSNFLTETSHFDNMLKPTPQVKQRFQGIEMTQYEASLLPYIVEPGDISEKFDDIGGAADIKEDVMMNVVIPLQHHHKFFKQRLKCISPTRGIIFIGAPGTGKTMFAKAIAKESGVNFLCLTLSALENKYFGESSKLLSSVFSLAKKIQPCIIFFDEIDGMMRERSAEEQSCSYGFKTEFLTHMDGMKTDSKDAVVVIGCTNNMKVVDAAMKRRLPKVYKMNKPDADERKKILKLLCTGEPAHARIMDNASIEKLVENTDGFTGSDLSELYKTAANLRMKRQLKSQKFRMMLESDSSLDEDSILPIRKTEWNDALAEVVEAKAAAESNYALSENNSSKLNDLLSALTKSTPKHAA